MKHKRERCPACDSLRQPSAVKRLQPIEVAGLRCVDSIGGVPVLGYGKVPVGFVRYRYECSRGHQFDGAHFHSSKSHAELHNKE